MSTTQMNRVKQTPPEKQARHYRVERRFSGERYAKDAVKNLFHAHSRPL